MRVFFFMALLYFIATDGIAQSSTKQRQEEEVIFCGTVRKVATTDMEAWKVYLAQNMDPDSLFLDSLAAGSYSIRANIIIDTCGRINVDRIINDPGYGIGGRFKSVLENYPLRWIPAERNGRKVKEYRRQPLVLIIEEEENCVTEPAAAMLSPG
jgi:hypothetical protein